MNNKTISYIIAIFLCATSAVSQAQTNTLSQVEAMISARQYSSALDYLDKISTADTETVDYYRLLCLIRMNASSATSRMDAFLENYPASTRRLELIIAISDALWQNNDYAGALKYYRVADKFAISDKELRSTFTYRKAYCAYALEDYSSARNDMYTLISDPTYGPDATYAYAHMCYQMGDVSLSAQYFEKIKDNEKYSSKIASYLSGIYFDKGDYAKSIAAANDFLASTPDKNSTDAQGVKNTLCRAYFNNGDYQQCIPMLREKMKKEIPSPEEQYMLGYSLYKCGDYTAAEASLAPLSESSGEYAQMCYYILGDIYIKSGKKSMALTAYHHAADLTAHEDIKANAWYNYAMLSYEIGNPYMSVSEVMREYLSRYPDSPHASTVYDYLIDSFLSAKEYEQAVDCIQSMGLTSDKSLKALQRAAYYLAGQKLNAREYDAAIRYYRMAIENDFDASFTARAHFWAGETYIRMGQYAEAEKEYEAFAANPSRASLQENKRLDYQIGYLASQKGDYSLAHRHFSSYLKKGLSAEEAADVYMRLGDCEFALGQYRQAQNMYSKAMNSKHLPKDYLSYQMALCMGIQGEYNAQARALNSFLSTYTNSSLRASARYELGLAYQRLGKNEEAIAAFLAVEGEKTAPTDLIAQGKSRAATAYYNAGESEKALSLYKEIVEKYPSSPVTPQSMRWARQISVECGKSDEFIAWNAGINSTPIDMMSMDSLQWETARKFYTKQDFTQAITHLNTYTSKYPSGLFLPDAVYTRAQSYLQVKDTTKAKADFYSLTQAEGGKYTENALLYYTDLMIKADSAYYCLEQLEKLYQTAAIDENKKYAAINLLGIYYDEGDWEGVKKYADVIREQYASDQRLYADATVALFASLVEDEQYDLARKMSDEVMKIASDENMARALYCQSKIQYQDKDYDASVATITRLCSEYSMYKYIGGRALLLLAQNYFAKNDSYQAEYVLNNIISSTTYSDIRAEAQVILEYIKSKNENK